MSWSEANRPFRLKTPLGADVLLVSEWDGEERVGTLFRFTVRAWSARADIAAKDLLLKTVTLLLRLPDGTDRSIHGVVSRFSQGGTAPVGLTAYELEIVPPHWMLSLDTGFDIFQNQSARDVCGALLKGTPFEWKLVRTLEPRPYCMRYRESRWQCVARLLEQEGVWFRFDHSGSEAKLVLADSVASAQAAWGVDTLHFSDAASTDTRLAALRVESQPFVAETRLRTASEFHTTRNVGNVVSSSGSFKPPADLKAYAFEQQLAAHRSGISHSGGETSGDAGKLPDDTKVYARLRQEAAEARGTLYHGESSYSGLQAGARTTVKDHPTAALNVPLFVLAVRHKGANGSYTGGDKAEPSYTNHFEAIPASTPYRPPRTTPWPHVGGSHVGTVVGPAGEEIYTDKHGRVQVVFRWDVENATSLDRACWIRVAQPFAGQSFGAVFLPRIGHEVLVEFLDGNPDNPIIVGSLYNDANLPPWKLPDHKTQSGVRTHSTLKGGADDFNELRFEDKKDAELLYMQAQKDLETLVKNDERRKVLHDRTTTIKRHDEKTVEEGDDKTTVSKGEQVITVADNNRTLTVAKNHSVTVGENDAATIGKDRALDVGQNEETTIGANATLSVGADRSHTVGGNESISVGGTLEHTVGGDRTDEVGGSHDISVNGSLSITVGQSITISAGQKITLKVGANVVEIDASGVTVKGTTVAVQGQATAVVKGAITEIKGSGMVKIQGGVTMIN